MKKMKIFLNLDKEEKWLDSMASQGWMLKDVSVWNNYSFEKSEPLQNAQASPAYRVDYRHFAKTADFNEYRQLFEDSGWKHIAGTKNTGNQYFKRMGANSTEDIFSDTASRAGRYKRLSYMMLSFAVIFIPLIVNAITQGTMSLDAFVNPKALWYTPGLWEMSGDEFWVKFLFEMPFALGRGFGHVIPFLFILAYVFLALKSWSLYRKAMNTDKAGKNEE